MESSSSDHDAASSGRLAPVRARMFIGEQEWAVRRYVLSEALGRTHRLDADLVGIGTDIELAVDEIIGQEMELVLERGANERIITGIVCNAAMLPSDGARQRIRILGVPAVGLAAQSSRCRIFQDQSVIEIVQEVFREIFERFDRSMDTSRLVNAYPRRDYRVQYDEDDLAFANRILEEEGITYFFEPSNSGETLVLVDDATGFEPLERPTGGNRLRLCTHDPDNATDETIHAFEWKREVRAGRMRHGQWKWKDGPGMLESFAADPERGDPWEFFEHASHDVLAPHGRDAIEPEPDTTPQSARIGLEQTLARAQVATARANAIELRPGVVFELGDHPDPDLERSFTVVEIEHRGDIPDAESFGTGAREATDSTSSLICIPAEVPFRRRPPPKPLIHGIHTAVVVGHEEIDTDVHGRIRVRMRWDREAKDRSDPIGSSCWMRVSMPWAGAGFGAFFLPRVGMEVLIAYLDGDPDRPLCVGCVHNGETPPPYPLPEHKTRSTIRTKSSPGGDGFNELRFEDAAGAEEIFVHAQRDMNTKVLRNDSSSVGNDQSCTVGHDQTLTVRNDREALVEGHERCRTKKDHMRGVEGSEEVIIVGSQLVQVGGGKGAGKAVEPAVPGAELRVLGTYTVFARDRLVLQVGADTMLEMTPAGITLKAPALVHAEVQGVSTTMSPGMLLSKAPVVEMFGQGSHLVLSSEALLSSTARVRSQSGESHVTVDPVMVRAEGPNAIIDGTTLATVQSGGITSVTGTNITVDAQVSVGVTATGAIELSAGGNTQTIAGGVVGLGD